MGDREVRSVVERALAGRGVCVGDVTLVPAGRRRVLRVTVERDLSGLSPDDVSTPIPPLSLDEVADASRLVDAALDAADPLGAVPYVLEVSSSGVGRPLQGWAAWRRNVGRLVDCRLDDGEQLIGRLTAVAPRRVTIADPQAGAPREVDMEAIDRAVVQVEFGAAGDRADEPTSRPAPDVEVSG